MRIRQALVIILMIVVCVWIISPALAAPGSPTPPPAAPAPAAGAKGQGGTGESHPVIQEAIKELEHTKALLVKEAAHDFQGHRTKAVQDIDQALQELHTALQADKK
jgi:Spy/CpxP family protein refolding chaperone